MSWYQAAAYCNWLSKEEGIDEKEWCYEIKGKVTKLKENYLSLSGYRLPTEAEMEYATRAGAVTSRYFGETEELLPKYAWYTKNSKEQTWPVGSLKPNDLGLFDVQGNVFTWCQESYKAYPTGKGEEAAEDKEDELVISPTQSRVLRGGSFHNLASNVRSAYRINIVPTIRSYNNGFRLARTLPLDPFTALPPTPKGSKNKNEHKAPVHYRGAVMAYRKDFEELTVITKTYDLILWCCNHTGKFPRNHRFVLGERIERNLYDLLEIIDPGQVHQATSALAGEGKPDARNPAIPDAARQGLAMPQGRELRLR